MGTVVTYERTETFFARTLARIEPLLRAHGYCGYINLNTIVNGSGIWPLEFTCRFGYPGFAVLDPLQETRWAELFGMMIRRDQPGFVTRPGFALGIVLTTPPFPYTRRQVAAPVGMPVLIDGSVTAEDDANLHYGEVGLDAGRLVTTGIYGWTMVATGRGATIAAAQEAAYRLAARVFAPNLRYRLDIGARLIAGDFATVERLGLLDPAA
jgi:phosphoribosylamine--glycine ligase